jgi:hypothetical protein
MISDTCDELHLYWLPQLVRLLEGLEIHMINEVRKRVAKELTLSLAERGREENALPTDLWKRAVSDIYIKFKYLLFLLFV